MQIYIHRDNRQLGPFTEAEIKTQLASGAVSLQDHVWWEGQANWIPLGQSSLAATLAPTAPGSAPTVPIPVSETASVPLANATAPETSNLAIWALVCGCMSVVLSLLASIPAIILGHMGLNQIKKNPSMRGHGMALTGLILGYVFTFLLPIISIVAISVLIALGNQVQSVFSTISSQLAVAQAADNADQSATTPDQTTNAPDQTTPAATPTTSPDQSMNSAPATTTSPDQSTNSAPAATNSPDSSTNSSTPSTNAPDSSTNAAPMSQ